MKKIVYLLIVLFVLWCFMFYINEYFKKKNSYTFDNSNEVINNNINLTSYDEIIKYLDNSNKHMLVIGRSGCHHCNMFKPVLEETSNLYKFEYKYVDLLKLSSEDKKSLLHSDILIPGKCRENEKDGYLYEGFGTPITLFIENKTSYNCIRGYVDKSKLINILTEIGYINI